MQRKDLRTACLIMALAFTSGLTTSGFDFLTNQYVFYRFSEDAHLPYEVNGPLVDCGQSLVLSTADYNNQSDPLRRARDVVQAKTAKLLALSTLLSLVLGVVASMLVGLISDRYGRSFTTGLILFGQALRFITITFMVLFSLPVTMLLLLSATFSGLIGGGWIAFLVQLSVSFTDITRIPDSVTDGLDSPVDNEHRSVLERRRLILLGCFDATNTLSSAIGTAVIGSTIEHFGFVPTALGLLVMFTIPVALIRGVPETKRPPISVIDLSADETSPLLPAHTDQRCGTERNTALGAPRDGWMDKLSAMRNIIKNRHPANAIILMAIFLYSLAIFTEGQYVFLYLMSAPFCWSPEDVGLYNGLNSLMLAGASTLLTLVTAWTMPVSRPVTVQIANPVEPQTAVLLTDSSEESTASWPQSDRLRRLVQRRALLTRLRLLIYVIVGFFMICISKLVMGFAFHFAPPLCNRAAFVALFAGVLRAAVIPTLKSLLSSLHSADAQGRLFSLIGFCEYMGLIFGQPSLPVLYANTVSTFPGAVFLFSAGLSAFALFLVTILLHSVMQELSSTEFISTLTISVSN